MVYTGIEVERLIAFLAQECEWQRVGPRKVSYYASAYFHLGQHGSIDVPLIQTLGHLIEPHHNPALSWRRINVAVGNHVAPDWQEVPRLMDQLLLFVDELTATEFFREFEEIHPFRDGNGRTGALLYNWLNGTYHPMDLEFSPNLWNDPRRAGVTL